MSDHSISDDSSKLLRRDAIKRGLSLAALAALAGCEGNQEGDSGGDQQDNSGGGDIQGDVPTKVEPKFWRDFNQFFENNESWEKTDAKVKELGPHHPAEMGVPVEPLPVSFAPDDEAWMREHALMIQRSFNDLGVPVELLSQPLNVMYSDQWVTPVGQTVPVTMNTHGPDQQRALDPDVWLARMAPDHPINLMNYWNDEIWDLLKEQIKELKDRQRRVELVHEIQDLMSEDLWFYNTGYPDVINVANTEKFTGYVGTPGNGFTRDSFIWTQVNIQPQTDTTTFVKGVTTQLNSLNMPWGTGGVDARRLMNFYSSLFDASPDLELVPSLGTNLDVPDQTTVEVDLREGVKWHDGTDFTPEDVKFTAEIYKQHGATAMPTFYKPIESVEILSKTGGGRVRFNLNSPDAGFRNFRVVQGAIMPKHQWEGVDAPQNFSPDPPIGTGPFKFESWEQGSQLRASKWENNWMWDDEIRREQIGDDWFEPGDGIDELVYVVIPNYDSLIGALQSGDIDAIGTSVSLDQASRATSAEGIEQLVVENFAPLDVHFSHLVPLIRDKEFRHAFAHSVDSEGFFEEVLQGYGSAQKPDGGKIAPAHGDWYNPDAYSYEYDVEYAKERLQKAGYTWNDNGDLVWPDGEAWKAFIDRIQPQNTHKTREELNQPDFS